MKELIHKIMAIIMSFVVLFSTMSFSVGMHYCGGSLIDTAFFDKANSCGMEIQKEMSSTNDEMITNDCCHDEEILIKGQKELKISFDSLDFHQQVFIASFVYSYLNPLVDLNKKEITFDDYPPPLIVKTIYKLDEVYLI